jgi:hypothetical protein
MTGLQPPPVVLSEELVAAAYRRQYGVAPGRTLRG